MNILVLTFWSYKSGLIQTYTLPYLKQIAEVIPDKGKLYLLTLEKENLALNEEEKKAADSYLAEHKIKLISFKYNRFGIVAAFKWIWIHIYLLFTVVFKNINYIQSFCTPPSVAGSVLSSLTGRKLIIDSYEPHAEASLENGDWTKDSFAFKFLFGFEKFLSHKAHTIISATQGMRTYAKEKYDAEFERFYVKPACVDLSLFTEENIKKPDLIKELGFEGKIVAVYAGKFGGIYLDQEVFDFLKVAQDYWGDIFRILMLTNQSDEELNNWADKSGFDMRALSKRFVMHSDIPDYIGLGDFGLTPVKPIPTKRYCTPIKNGEYWALGLPIISTANISDDSEIIEKENIGSIIHEFNNDAYLTSVKEIDNLLKNSDSLELYKKIRGVAEKYRSFEISKKIYTEIYSSN